jgi:hypothetical protein
VLTAVHLNDQAMLGAIEIEDVPAESELAPEFGTFELPISESDPQEALRVCRRAAQ